MKAIENPLKNMHKQSAINERYIFGK